MNKTIPGPCLSMETLVKRADSRFNSRTTSWIPVVLSGRGLRMGLTPGRTCHQQLRTCRMCLFPTSSLSLGKSKCDMPAFCALPVSGTLEGVGCPFFPMQWAGAGISVEAWSMTSSRHADRTWEWKLISAVENAVFSYVSIWEAAREGW